MKKSIFLLAVSLFSAALFAQNSDFPSDDELFGGSGDFSSDDALFGGTSSDDDLFGASADDDMFSASDDDLFGDDGIDVVQDTSAKSDLSKGIIFDSGSVKIGGNFTTALSTMTTLYADDKKSFGDHIEETALTPSLSSFLTFDARPTETLRMYTKFGISYPFASNSNTSLSNWFSLKELFTDFSIKDRAFFRFGYHTVTWGTGYFYSPVSDMINTSTINPENTSEQVNGCLNLRTQITFPGSQNCLWFYIIPSADFTGNNSATTYIRDTALAGKFDLVLGNWEFGLGSFWKYQNSPRAMLTASGSLKNYTLFGEFVYRYGTDSEWGGAPDEWSDKTSVFQVTAGLSRYWKNQNIFAALQYYYNSYEVDGTYYLTKFLSKKLVSSDYSALTNYVTQGHNLAAVVNFGRLFGTKDLTASIFALANFQKRDTSDVLFTALKTNGVAASLFNSMTISGLLYYSPIKELKFGLGPYIIFSDFESAPNVALKLDFSLGGGKF